MLIHQIDVDWTMADNIKKLNILILDDSDEDAEIEIDTLERESVPADFVHIYGRDDFIMQLDRGKPDIILADLNMPSFDGFEALDIARKKYPDVPLIFVSGAMGEEIAVQALKKGAADYVLKSHISKIVPSVRNAIANLNEKKLRREAEDNLEKLRYRNTLILEAAGEGIIGLDEQGLLTFVNLAAANFLLYEPDDLIGISFIGICDTPDVIKVKREMDTMPFPMGLQKRETIFRRKDNSMIPVEYVANPIIEGNSVMGYVISFSDITERKQTQENLRSSFEKLRKNMYDTVDVMASTLELRDPYTAGHQRRVAGLACRIAGYLCFDDHVIEGIRIAGVVHDIGKIQIPAEILSKPTRLSSSEFLLMKEHPQAGYEILKNIDFPWPVAQTVLQHHERLDGSGYPQGLKGEMIIREARILSVADVVEAMASHRPYRPALGIQKAIEEIESHRGSWFDEDAADACIRIVSAKDFSFE